MSQINYYLCPPAIVDSLKMKNFRIGDDSEGYILSSSDLAPYGIDKAIHDGASILPHDDASKLVKKFNK